MNLSMRQRPGVNKKGGVDATAEEREKLWGVLQQMTGFEYPF